MVKLRHTKPIKLSKEEKRKIAEEHLKELLTSLEHDLDWFIRLREEYMQNEEDYNSYAPSKLALIHLALQFAPPPSLKWYYKEYKKLLKAMQ